MMVHLQVLTLCVRVDGMIDLTILLIQTVTVSIVYSIILYICWRMSAWNLFAVMHIAFFGLMIIAYAV